MLIDRYDDRLDVVETIALKRGHASNVGERFYPRRVFGVVVVPFEFMRRSSSPRFRVMSS